MCVERLATAAIRPTWIRPSSGMRIRYLSHPALRLAFIQAIEEPDAVYVVSDERLPETFDEAAVVIATWRMEHG